VCALRPGVPGVSENIMVRSIVGRFLEHSRVFYYENGGKPELFCASADWMERNFFRRVEVAFPIHAKAQAERIERDLGIVLHDNCQSWQLRPDGSYERIKRGDAKAVNAQMELLSAHAAGPGTTA
jgi:polyphosphate kinase